MTHKDVIFPIDQNQIYFDNEFQLLMESQCDCSSSMDPCSSKQTTVCWFYFHNLKGNIERVRENIYREICEVKLPTCFDEDFISRYFHIKKNKNPRGSLLGNFQDFHSSSFKVYETLNIITLVLKVFLMNS